MDCKDLLWNRDLARFVSKNTEIEFRIRPGLCQENFEIEFRSGVVLLLMTEYSAVNRTVLTAMQ